MSGATPGGTGQQKGGVGQEEATSPCCIVVDVSKEYQPCHRGRLVGTAQWELLPDDKYRMHVRLDHCPIPLSPNMFACLANNEKRGLACCRALALGSTGGGGGEGDAGGALQWPEALRGRTQVPVPCNPGFRDLQVRAWGRRAWGMGHGARAAF